MWQIIDGQKEDKKESGKLEKITVCEPVRGILWAPVYVAKAEGYFEEEGLDVDITTVQSDMPTAPVLPMRHSLDYMGRR